MMYKGITRDSRLTFCYVDVLEAARALEERHLAGPHAALVLGQALAGVALASGDLTLEQERISFRMMSEGPIGGFLVEASVTGNLRGYTQVKVLNALDGQQPVVAEKALGEKGEVFIIRSLPGKVVSQAHLHVRPASVEQAMKQYFNHSLQVQTLLAVSAGVDEQGLNHARAVAVQCMPDSDLEVFKSMREFFAIGDARRRLVDLKQPQDCAAWPGLETLEINEERPLQFGCPCSLERVEQSLAALDQAELRKMLEDDKPQQVYCHMCGQAYTITREAVMLLLGE
jgi:molecular chaperone Hsp33